MHTYINTYIMIHIVIFIHTCTYIHTYTHIHTYIQDELAPNLPIELGESYEPMCGHVRGHVWCVTLP